MIWNSKLYPWQPYRTFDSLDKAIVYALEIDGYRKLWMVILWAEQNLTLTVSILFCSGCATLDADMIRALSQDSASFCARAGASGGAGGGGLALGALTGGWGQGEFAFCRSNHDGTMVKLGADGSLSIEHR